MLLPKNIPLELVALWGILFLLNNVNVFCAYSRDGNTSTKNGDVGIITFTFAVKDNNIIFQNFGCAIRDGICYINAVIPETVLTTCYINQIGCTISKDGFRYLKNFPFET